MWTAGGFDRNGREAIRTIFRSWRGSRGRLLHPVKGADEQENDESHDQEIDRRIEEQPIVEGGRSCRLCIRDRLIRLAIQA